MGASEQYQDHFKIGDDDNADPDLCSFDALDTERTGQEKNANFMIRIQVHNAVADSAAAAWNLYYNDEDDPETATKVTTASTVAKIVDGTPADAVATDDHDVVYDASGSYTWADGEYSESDDTDKLGLTTDYYTDFQWCVQFDNNAADNTTYYFYVRRADSELDGYSQVAKVKTAEGAAIERSMAGALPSMNGSLVRKVTRKRQLEGSI